MSVVEERPRRGAEERGYEVPDVPVVTETDKRQCGVDRALFLTDKSGLSVSCTQDASPEGER